MIDRMSHQSVMNRVTDLFFKGTPPPTMQRVDAPFPNTRAAAFARQVERHQAGDLDSVDFFVVDIGAGGQHHSVLVADAVSQTGESSTMKIFTPSGKTAIGRIDTWERATPSITVYK